MQLPVLSESGGVIIYKGPSVIDNEDIVVIATGLRRSSRNKKTGKIIQTWIMRENQNPVEAHNDGNDVSVCGDCKARYFGSCYVNLAHGPYNVWMGYKRGSYNMATPESLEFFRDEFVRFGSYGDPAAVPIQVWQSLLPVISGWTGYTHQWRTCDPAYKQLCMASCDLKSEADRARDKGWKPFLVLGANDDVPDSYFICPASEEGGKKIDCERCGACRGGELRNVKQGTPVIYQHGASFKRVRWANGIKLIKSKKGYRGVNVGDRYAIA